MKSMHTPEQLSDKHRQASGETDELGLLKGSSYKTPSEMQYSQPVPQDSVQLTKSSVALRLWPNHSHLSPLDARDT